MTMRQSRARTTHENAVFRETPWWARRAAGDKTARGRGARGPSRRRLVPGLERRVVGERGTLVEGSVQVEQVDAVRHEPARRGPRPAVALVLQRPLRVPREQRPRERPPQ